MSLLESVRATPIRQVLIIPFLELPPDTTTPQVVTMHFSDVLPDKLTPQVAATRFLAVMPGSLTRQALTTLFSGRPPVTATPSAPGIHFSVPPPDTAIRPAMTTRAGAQLLIRQSPPVKRRQAWNSPSAPVESFTQLNHNEIIMVQNDPDHMERGIIAFDVKGGRQ